MSGPSPPPLPPPPPVVQTYQPKQPGLADQQYMDLSGQLGGYASSLPGQLIPQYQDTANQIMNNPYAAPAQAGINQVAQQGGQFGQGLMGLSGMAGQGAQQIYNAGFDPRQDIYNRQFQQMTDQSNAVNSMYGLGSSPYGAGVANQAAQNFNMDWQNQQLQRMTAGAQGFQALSGAGTQLGQQGLSAMTGAATAPYAQYTGNLSNNITALNTLGQGSAASLQPGYEQLRALGNYLGIGQQATQSQNAANVNQYNAVTNAQQQQFQTQQQASSSFFGGIGDLFGTIGGALISNPEILMGAPVGM